jgi:hypothetical protein
MAQVIEYLPSKLKALSSNPSDVNKEKKLGEEGKLRKRIRYQYSCPP